MEPEASLTEHTHDFDTNISKMEHKNPEDNDIGGEINNVNTIEENIGGGVNPDSGINEGLLWKNSYTEFPPTQRISDGDERYSTVSQRSESRRKPSPLTFDLPRWFTFRTKLEKSGAVRWNRLGSAQEQDRRRYQVIRRGQPVFNNDNWSERAAAED